MQANTGAPRHGLDGLQVDWNHFRTWGDKTLTKERLAEIGLIAATGTVLGYVIWFVAKAAENYTILGVG